MTAVVDLEAFTVETVRTSRELDRALRTAGFSKSFSRYVVAGWRSPEKRAPDSVEVEDILASLRRGSELIRAYCAEHKEDGDGCETDA